MILSDFKIFPKIGRIIGIDWGAQRTGIAVSNESRQIVFTRKVLKTNSMLEELLKIINDEHIVGMVLGLPLYMDGSESDTSKKVREFANCLANKTDLPIVFIDETLTSMCAQEFMGRTNIGDIKQKLDSESARIILENAISIINRM